MKFLFDSGFLRSRLNDLPDIKRHGEFATDCTDSTCVSTTVTEDAVISASQRWLSGTDARINFEGEGQKESARSCGGSSIGG